MGKTRISATVDKEALAAGRAAVAEGRALNLSVWINEAMHERAELDRRLKAMDEFLAGYEREHGEITEEEMDAAWQQAQERAIRTGPSERSQGAGTGRRVAEKSREYQSARSDCGDR